MPSPRFRLLTASAALAGWVLVAVGGIVRVTASGLGCPHWPLCTSRALPLDARASVIEYSHRAVVALVSLLAIAVAINAWRTCRARRDIVVPALLAVVLLPAQALLGAVAVWLVLPAWIVAVHFVVGLLFLATLVLTAAASWRRRALRPSVMFARLAAASVFVGLALVSVGAAVVATDAGDACGTQWPGCNGGFVAGGGHAELQVVHRTLAYVLAALTLALLILALRGAGPRLAGSLPFLVVCVQISLGIAIVLVGGAGRAHEILAGLHVGGAGAVWGSLVALAVLVRDPARPVRARALTNPAAVQQR